MNITKSRANHYSLPCTDLLSSVGATGLYLRLPEVRTRTPSFSLLTFLSVNVLMLQIGYEIANRVVPAQGWPETRGARVRDVRA